MTQTTSPTVQTARDALAAKVSSQTTDMLFAALAQIDKLESPEHRMVHAYITGELEERHGLTELMDAIYMDDNYTGTYADAIRLAYAIKTA